MFSKVLSAAAVALTASQLVSAQTFTKCNPLEKTCPDDSALGKTVTVDFTKGANDVFSAADGTTINFDKTLGAAFSIAKDTDAPTIISNDYIFFGKVDVTVRAAPGTGVVTSFVLQSDDLDEIDWEWLGGDTAQVQTNYFGKGDTTTYDRGGYSSVANPQSTFHTYTIDWTKDYVKWSIDGAVVRTLNYADAQGGTRFPQTPCQIKLGTWDAGAKSEPSGTVQWAGGYTNFDDAPFVAYYQSITIQDYMNGASSASKYHWKDNTGSYESIEIVGGSGGSSTSSGSSSSTTSGVSSSAKTSTASTMATFAKTSASGLTQATASSNSSSSAAASSTSGSSSSGSTSSSSSAPASSSTHATASGASIMEWSPVVMMAAVFFGLLAL